MNKKKVRTRRVPDTIHELLVLRARLQKLERRPVEQIHLVCVCVCVCLCVCVCVDLQILGSGDSLCVCVRARADLEILGRSDDLKRARLFEVTRQNLLAVTPDFAYSAV
jgi:hypothetical protein